MLKFNNMNKIKSTFIKAYGYTIKNMTCKMEAI